MPEQPEQIRCQICGDTHPTEHHDRIEKNLEIRKQRAEKGPSGIVERFAEKYDNEFVDGDTVLEVGVGEGRNLEAFKDRKLKLYGVELNHEIAKFARQSLQEKGVDATILEGSFTDLSHFPDASVRAVIGHSSVQNAKTWEDLEKAFSEIERVLKPKGLYLFRENRKPRLIDADRKTRVAYFTENELHGLIEKYGFDLIEGEKPVDSGSDPERVDGRRVAWEAVLRKKENVSKSD